MIEASARSTDAHYDRFLKRADLQPMPKKTAMAEERRLFEAMWAGDTDARDRLIKANTKFCASVARNYRNRGLAYHDLFSEAVLGLCRAVDRFDPNMGFKFISYAVWWIRQGILMALASQGRTYAVPTALFSTFRAIDAARAKLEQSLGRRPTTVEIAEEMGVAVQDVEEARSTVAGTLSLDYEIDPDGEVTLGQMLISEDRTDEGVLRAQDKAYVAGLMKGLKPREQQVIREYFRLDSDGCRVTLKDVGEQMGLTRERVRQLKEKALKKMQDRANREIAK